MFGSINYSTFVQKGCVRFVFQSLRVCLFQKTSSISWLPFPNEPVCRFQFSSSKNYIQRISTYQCFLQFGGKSEQDLYLSIAHWIKDRSKPEDLKLKMEINSKTSKTQNDTKICLKSFIMPVHEQKKSFKCNICEAAFSQKVNLNRHIESVHKEKKPFKCNKSMSESTF